MKWFVLLLGVLHGAIHLLGFAKGLGLATIPQLQLPISRIAGWAWLLASVLLVVGALLVFVSPRFWGAIMLAGVILSQFLIFRHFQDAKFGTVANVFLLIPALINTADLRPTSLRSEYNAAVARVTGAQEPPSRLIQPEELLRLPDPVQKYLQRVGVVGKPHVYNVRARMRIQIRGGQSEPWMNGVVEQYNSFDPTLRYFFLDAKRGPVPIDVAHLFDERGATMRARVVGLFPVMDAQGDDLTRGETVTVLNDMCLLAPATLLDPRLEWAPIDATHVAVTLSHAKQRVSAILWFSDDGDLVNFVSKDRAQSDGKTSKLYPWWTPLSDYRQFGDYRLASVGEAQWEEPSGRWTYAKVQIVDVKYNVSR